MAAFLFQKISIKDWVVRKPEEGGRRRRKRQDRERRIKFKTLSRGPVGFAPKV